VNQKRLTKALFAIAGATLLMSAFPALAQDAITVTPGPITQKILDSGKLICGVNDVLPGFGAPNDDGVYEGFDVDICRAVAAAVLNDADAVEYRPLVAAQRQAAIQSGEIDMMSRNTTETLSRDSQWAAIFGPVTFYDGQGIMVQSASGVTDISGLDGASMCVQSGTTTELNIKDYIEAKDVAIELLVFNDANATWNAYLEGRCESWTTDKSGLASYAAGSDDPSAHSILAETLSKEPLAPLSPQSDPQFAEVVEWTVFALIQAEEFGITSENIADFLPTEGEADEAYIARVTPEVARFLGQANNSAGDYLGIPNDFVVNVITAVGNYGEIYERNLTPLGLSREGSPNDLWTNGGLLYSPPFR
jgi:general L-amino acid transport system substrate-binding protein